MVAVGSTCADYYNNHLSKLGRRKLHDYDDALDRLTD